MKLRSKKTGEIGELNYYDGFLQVVDTASPLCGNSVMGEYTTFSAINEEWEDYEEPKEYWYIDWTPEIGVYHTRDMDSDADKRQKQIGNYFETKEEAEKAVDKLKAWKRLKDIGFKFTGWKSYEETSGLSFPDRHIVNSYTAIFDFNKPCRKYEIENEIKADLDLLFGGEE